jgi:hypothetical protein
MHSTALTAALKNAKDLAALVVREREEQLKKRNSS